MVDDDIYHNKKKFENFVKNLNNLLKPPEKDDLRRKYWIKNKVNLKYFQKLFIKFKARDNSYIRRLRLLRTFLIINHVIEKDLSEITNQDEIDLVMGFANEINKSPKSKRDFALDTKFLWRQLFPEKDNKGRIDTTIIPYPVRHLTGKIDKSKEKLRGDKFSYEEYEKLISIFSDDPRMQALLSIAFESLARPQELLGRKIKDVELFDNYAKIYISEHGKEGVGLLRIIESYFYLNQWYNKHPLKHDPEAYLFINTGRRNKHQQMTPTAANKLIRERCKKLKISSKITLYSLKRNGVTLMRLGGASDLDIQHTARWTSTKQLKTYDLSTQEESFKIELIKRGRIKADKKYKKFEPENKKCPFCDSYNGIAEKICDNCKRPLDREKILSLEKEKDQKLNYLEKQMVEMKKMMEMLVSNNKEEFIQETKNELIKRRKN